MNTLRGTLLKVIYLREVGIHQDRYEIVGVTVPGGPKGRPGVVTGERESRQSRTVGAPLVLGEMVPDR